MAQCAAESAISSAPQRGSVSCCAVILKYPRYIEPPVSGVRVIVCYTWKVPAPKVAAEIYIRTEGLKSGISGLPFTPSSAGVSVSLPHAGGAAVARAKRAVEPTQTNFFL